MVAADFSDYLQFVLTDPRHCGNNSFYTATDALLTLEAEIVQKEETQAKGEQRTQKQIERLPVLEMLRKYGLGEEREHLLLAGKPGSGKSTTLRRLCVEMAETALGDNLQPIPVFVQLKGDKQIVKLIQAEFRRAKLRVTDEQIDDWLLEDKLVLLLDGVNEIPSEELRRELQDFRENNLTTPTIFTTRDLTVGGSLGIDKRLEMRPLTDLQMREFVHKYLPEHGDKLLGQLRDRLREIAETPLLLKMLCEVFEPQTGRIPQNKAELFELFDRKYQRHKDGVAISADFRRFQSEILQYLAFTMLQGDAEKPTEAWLTLSRSQAEGIIEAWLKHRGETDPASKAKEWLEDLVEHHLLQVAANPQQIEFHHQLFQEYYAARHLRSMLQDKHPDFVDDDRLKHFYLNYLKWTEPLGLLLGLLDDESQALRLVGLGLEVDWFLGARLAGDVKENFQPQIVGLIDKLINDNNLPQWLMIELWGRAQLSVSIPKLLPFLKGDEDFYSVQFHAQDTIALLTNRTNLPDLLPLLEDFKSSVRSFVVNVVGQVGDKSNVSNLLPLLQDSKESVRYRALEAIGQVGVESNVIDLLPLLQHSDLRFQERVLKAISQLMKNSNVIDLLPLLQHSNSVVRYGAVEGISQQGDRSNVPDLLPLLQDVNYAVQRIAVETIGQLGDRSNVPDLLSLLQHPDYYVQRISVETIGQLGDRSNVPDLLPLLQHPDYYVQLRIVETVGKLGDESNLPDLLPILQHSDSYVPASAIAAIVQLANKSKVNEFKMNKWLSLLQHSDSYIRSRAAEEILRLTNKTSSLPDWITLLQHYDSHVRSTAVRAMGQLGNGSNVPDLLPLLQDNDNLVRWRAVEVISKLGNESNVPYLLPLLQDSNPTIRASVVEVISKLGNGSNVPDLLPFLQDSSSIMRASVVKGISQLGNWDDVPDLLSFLQHFDSAVRKSVVEVISKLGDGSNVPDLLPFLQDPDYSVQRSVVEAISQLGGEEAVVALTHVVKVREANMRKSAIVGLGEITEWEKVSSLTQSLAIEAVLNSLKMEDYTAAAESLIKIGNYKILPRLCQKLAKSSDDKITRIILSIQARCEFYDYDIFRFPPPSIQPLLTKSDVYNVENNFPNATEVKIFENIDQYYQTPPKDSSS
jgi:HEAT repeat protein